MSIVKFADLSQATKKMVMDNKWYQSFPSGTSFGGFDKPRLQTPDGLLLCTHVRDPADCHASSTRYEWVN